MSHFLYLPFSMWLSLVIARLQFGKKMFFFCWKSAQLEKQQKSQTLPKNKRTQSGEHRVRNVTQSTSLTKIHPNCFWAILQTVQIAAHLPNDGAESQRINKMASSRRTIPIKYNYKFYKCSEINCIKNFLLLFVSFRFFSLACCCCYS